MPASPRTTRTTGLVVALALLWGSGFLWIELALKGFSPIGLTFARVALGALVLVPSVLVRRLRVPAGPRMWLHVTVSALIANVVPYTLFAVAEQTVTSGLAGVLNATTPLWTVLVGAAAGGTRLTPRTVAGVLVGLAGVLVVSEAWTGPGGSGGGVIACLVAAASYGLAYVYQARFLTGRGLSALSLTAAQLAAATVLLAVALPFGGRAEGAPTPGAVTAVVVLGVLGTGLALIINFTLIDTEGPTAASVVTYLVPAVALVLGVVVLGEPARWTLPIGAVVIAAGIGVVRTTHLPRRPTT